MPFPSRSAAKLLIVEPDGRMLLFRVEPPGEKSYWVTPGGGVEPGESLVEAARRELIEETGVSMRVGAPVWQRTYVFTALDGVTKEQTEVGFLVRADEQFAPRPTHDLRGDEAVAEARWWSADEIEAASADETFYPEDLPHRLREALDAP